MEEMGFSEAKKPFLFFPQENRIEKSRSKALDGPRKEHFPLLRDE